MIIPVPTADRILDTTALLVPNSSAITDLWYRIAQETDIMSKSIMRSTANGILTIDMRTRAADWYTPTISLRKTIWGHWQRFLMVRTTWYATWNPTTPMMYTNRRVATLELSRSPVFNLPVWYHSYRRLFLPSKTLYRYRIFYGRRGLFSDTFKW